MRAERISGRSARHTGVRAAAALLSILGVSGPLCAQELEGPRGSPGPMFSIGLLVASAKPAGDSQWHQGLGGELAMLFPFGVRARVPMMAGGWAQLQGFDGVSGATRVSGGARLQAWFLLLDAGLAQQSADQVHSATGYAVLAPGLQLGPGALALRFSWPLGGGPHWPRETALTLTMRLPLFFGGEGPRRRGD